MKNFFKTSLIVLASLFVATLASSFVAASSENAVCIESVDGTALNISLSQSQCKGLTQEQVGDVFSDIYGEHYSKASISRMLDYLMKHYLANNKLL